MKANHAIIVPETHWDREWYLPFQEYRGKLVLLMDKLLNILKTNPDYKNFTMDGQVVLIEDYLEVRPNKEQEIKKYVKEGRLSIGPAYVLPDEFLISGESFIRNLMIGHQIANGFGKVMKVGYIPDPFGHISQLPQILSGFDLLGTLFWRGFANEFEEKKLNMEFIWNAPGNAASILAIHLIFSYGSLAELNTKTLNGKFKPALRKIEKMIKKFEEHTATPIILLNNGSDHHHALPEIPSIVKQWNQMHPDVYLEQADFEYYINKVIESKPQLKEFQGELRGGRYAHLLSGVFSARMWIKQRNTGIEYLYEKYSEPISTITWVLDKYHEFEYPKSYLLTGMKWLIKNHPHDSICGCSIDQVHDEMITRFDWAEQIALEVYKNSFLYLTNLINVSNDDKKYTLIIYNPLPWQRIDIVEFKGQLNRFAHYTSTSATVQGITRYNSSEKFPEVINIHDTEGNEIEYQHHFEEEEPRYKRISNICHKFSFLAEVPACGYKVYNIAIEKPVKEFIVESDDFKITRDYLENKFYRININSENMIEILDKKNGIIYEDICKFEDMGDWGDEYDFSGPYENQTDLIFTSSDAVAFERSIFINGPTQKTFKLRLNLRLPHSLSEDRFNREEWLVDNEITIYISLYKDIKRIDFKIEFENNSKDHRIRVLFPTQIKSDEIHADGHFHVISRNLKLPKADRWAQKPLATNHQKDFVSVSENLRTFAVLNKGLPEYEGILNQDGTITLAITLLRCIEWLSRDDFKTRKSHAGPGFKTPGAQCLGKHSFELSVTTTSQSNWLDSEIHLRGKEFNSPLKPIFPLMVQSPISVTDRVVLKPSGIISYFRKTKTKPLESYLESQLSFLKITNNNIVLSALKKSEEGNNIIVRVYNISAISQKTNLIFFDKLLIRQVKIVNLLESEPIKPIKAEIHGFNNNIIDITLEPNVIATIKINFELLE